MNWRQNVRYNAVIHVYFQRGEYQKIKQIFPLLHEEDWDQKLLHQVIFSFFQLWDFLQTVLLLKKYFSLYGYNDEIFLIKQFIAYDLGADSQKIINYYEKSDFTRTYPYALIFLINLYRNAGNYKKALEWISIAFKNFADNSRVIYNIALFFHFLGRVDMAQKLAWHAYQKDGYIYGLDLIFRIFSQKNMPLQKLKIFFKKCHISLDEYKNDLVSFGNIFTTLQDFQKAEKCYKTALRTTKFDYYAYNGLAYIYEKQKNFLKAKIFYKYALQINKNNFYSYNGLWNIFYYEKSFIKAKICYQKSLQINKNNFYALKKLGILFFKEKEFQKSYFLLQKAQKLNKKDFMIERYLQKLTKK